LRRLDPQVQRRVVEALHRLLVQDPSLDVRRLAGSELRRIRVGDWRVIFELDRSSHQIVVHHVLPHGRAYDR
jgi:mRNA-degrading endonuclease RelE of RelBE toxin-antitoxin system